MTDSPRTLSEVRDELDAVDADLSALLARRVSLVREAFTIKQRDNVAIDDPAREASILEAAAQAARGRGLDEARAREVFRAILAFARRA